MAIYRMTTEEAFGPDEIDVMTSAYETVLVDLRLNRDDPVTQLVAKSIVNIVGLGERDPGVAADRAIKALGV